MARLIAFGDSMTYGAGLQDCWQDMSKPSQYSWPALIASALDRKCINKSFPGSSNKRIWYTISRFKFQPDDMVLILWTYPDRTSVIKTPFNIVNLIANQVDRLGDEGTMAKSFYENLHSWYDSDLMSKLYIRDTTRYLSDMKVEFYQMIAEPRDKKLFENINYVPICLGEYERNYDRALDDNHAGPAAQLAFAKDFLKYINVEIKNPNINLETPKPLTFFEKILRKCR